MNKKDFRIFFRPVIIFFIAINAVCISCAKWLDDIKIDHTAVMLGNLILFFLTITACFIHIKALKNNNPYAFVRAVTLASFLKLAVIVLSVIIYFNVAYNPTIFAVITVMCLYIVYTIFEVKGAMNINRKRNAKN